MAKPLLTITENDRTETIVIDGAEYHLASFDDFSPVDQFYFKKTGSRLSKLSEKDDATEKEIAEVETLSEEIFQKVAGNIPEEVQKKLKPGAKQRIVNAYFLAFAGEVQETTEPRSQNGQPKQSPDSSGSTGEAP